jgi:hypothetical protein
MNSDNNEFEALQVSFGDKGTKVNAINYGHPHTEAIVESAIEVIRESETGRKLLKVMDKFNIPVQVIKGTDESGYSAEMRAIFLQVPGKVNGFNGEATINLIKSLREADLDQLGTKAPDPMKDVMGYAGFIHARNIDTMYYVCEVIKELTNSSYFSVLLDSLSNLGLNSFYKAQSEGASKEELYDYYAEAYNRGSN